MPYLTTEPLVRGLAAIRLRCAGVVPAPTQRNLEPRGPAMRFRKFRARRYSDENKPTRRQLVQTTIVGCVALWASHAAAQTTSPSTSGNAMQLTQDWDKTFQKSDKVDHQKVTFKNRYGITLAATCTSRRIAPAQRLAALAVGGPFRRCERAVLGLYAQTHGRARLRHAGFRSVLHRGKRRRAPQCRLAGHQHRGLHAPQWIISACTLLSTASASALSAFAAGAAWL